MKNKHEASFRAKRRNLVGIVRDFIPRNDNLQFALFNFHFAMERSDMLLMIDNYDSFTYNLVQYFGELGEDVRVYRNDKITVKEIEKLKPERIAIAPGPCDMTILSGLSFSISFTVIL